MQFRRNLSAMVLDLIRYVVKISGKKNVVLSGGYALNCVANYWYLEQLEGEGINLFVEPVSNDAGTALGAAMLMHHRLNPTDTRIKGPLHDLYTGFEYNHTRSEIVDIADRKQVRIEYLSLMMQMLLS